MTAPEQHPNVVALPYGTGRVVTIRCPYCRRRHPHGAQDLDRDLSHRVAHCSEGRGLGYVLVRAVAS